MKWAQKRMYKLSDLVCPELAFLWIVPTAPLDVTQSGYLGIINMNKIFSYNYNHCFLLQIYLKC